MRVVPFGDLEGRLVLLEQVCTRHVSSRGSIEHYIGLVGALDQLRTVIDGDACCVHEKQGLRRRSQDREHGQAVVGATTRANVSLLRATKLAQRVGCPKPPSDLLGAAADAGMTLDEVLAMARPPEKK